MSAAASLMPRNWPSNSVSRRPGGGTSTPTVKPWLLVEGVVSVPAGASVAGADVSPGAVVAVVESDELSEEQAATITAASTHDDSTRTALRKSDLGIASPCRSTTLWSPDEGTSGDASGVTLAG